MELMKKLITVLALAVISACFTANADRFTPITVTDINGKSVNLPVGHRCLVAFYWDECVPCHRAMKTLHDTENEVREALTEEWQLFEIWNPRIYIITGYDTQEEKQRIIERFKTRNWDTSRLYFVKDAKKCWNYLAGYEIKAVPAIMELNDKNEIINTFIGTSPTLGEKLFTIMHNDLSL